MPDGVRSDVFWAITDDKGVIEGDREYALNSIYFFNGLDKGMFDEHKQDWVLVYNQSVKWYGRQKYSGEDFADLQEEMPGVLYLPVDLELLDQELNPKIAAPRAVRFQCTNNAEFLVWSNNDF
jgi:hypothetical protein